MLHRKLLLILTLVFATTLAIANDSEYHHTVNGTDIYLGIVPAQQIPNQNKMHKETNKKDHLYHIVVALFNHQTGKRITNATVQATVASLGMTGETKQLEPMHEDVISYGNYFAMYPSSSYTIKVFITHPDNGKKFVAHFTVSP